MNVPQSLVCPVPQILLCLFLTCTLYSCLNPAYGSRPVVYCLRNTSHLYIHTLQLYSHTQNPFTITFYLNYITNKLLAKNSVTMHNDMKCMKYMNIYLVNMDYCTSPL